LNESVAPTRSGATACTLRAKKARRINAGAAIVEATMPVPRARENLIDGRPSA
jgi:hypothetical protein